MQIPIVRWNGLSEGDRKGLLERPALAFDENLRQNVSAIIERVRRDGDTVLLELTRQFDCPTLDSMRVTEREFAAAEKQVSASARDAIDLAIDNVRQFHRATFPEDVGITTVPGVRCERVSHPIDAVGLYVPAGSAPLPSTAIMLAVPASLAECPLRILCTPPRADGHADATVLFAARRAGVDTIFKLGGAQAIAAMAYGTETVPKVNKIFGPGNAWVTAAKTCVSADTSAAAIDMPAGPSEVLVIADRQANADYVAADLLSQAEHGPDSQVLLVTTSEALATAVAVSVSEQLGSLSRRDIASASMRHSRFIVVEDVGAAVRLSNDYAPEHLILQVADPRVLLAEVRNAGSVFLGCWSPESAGDYCSGTNHVLPTYGAARSFSGLGVEQFMRHMTVQELSRDGLQKVGPAIIELASLEGLDGHAAAVQRRLAVLPECRG